MFMFRSSSLSRLAYSTIKDEISFTAAFLKALSSRLVTRPNDAFLRLEIFAGQGCEGYTYKFKFDTTITEDDLVHSIASGASERIAFAVNKEEVPLLKGAVLDFASEMMKELFYVKENPNASVSCSCKTSFSPKEELFRL